MAHWRVALSPLRSTQVGKSTNNVNVREVKTKTHPRVIPELNFTLSSTQPRGSIMERDGDLLLNVSCSANQQEKSGRRLPARMPDGSKIESSRSLTRKIAKTHHPATSSGKVFIPNHKLPVLDEFGLSTPSDHVGFQKPTRMLPSLRDRESNPRPTHQPSIKEHTITQPSNGAKTEDKPEIDTSSRKAKRKKRKIREEEPKIIPAEVRAVAGGLPPSFPQHRIKKFTEEYHDKKRRRLEEGEDDETPKPKKKRRSFVPGLNPRKKEKAPHLFTDSTLEDLQDLHPYLVSNLEQNFAIEHLTRIQSLAMPALLKTRYDLDIKEFIINSGIGTGKILSYVVPIVNNLALMEPKIDRTAGIYALILLPTRELAADVNNIFVKLCRSFQWIVPGLLTGGERKKSEKARLRKGLNILITTPGRLIDHIEHSKSMSFSRMKYCVLADAHRLLDPERADVAKKIAIVLRKRLPHDCVRCIVTATFTKKLEKLCEIVVSKPHKIDAFKQFE